MKLFVCAVEPSADALGAALVEALRKQRDEVELIGCGGPLLKEAGLDSLVDITPFSVMGPVGALKALPAAFSATNVLARAAASAQPDCAVFIDSWSFSKMAAGKMKKAAPNVKRIKYVAPQVWASRPKRVEQLADYFDGLLCLFDFEARHFESAGVDVRIVGHSGFRAAQARPGDGARFRQRHEVGDAPLLAVLPGSRQGELNRLIRPFAEIVALLVERQPRLNVVIAAAPAIANQIPALTANWPAPVHIVHHAERYDAFAAADAALAASGTVTTELAIHETPMVVCYRMAALTAAYVRMVVTTSYASLLNIAAGREVIPEFIQERLVVNDVAEALYPLLSPGPERQAQLSAFPQLIENLAGKGPPPADLAAQAVIEWSGGENAKKVE